MKVRTIKPANLSFTEDCGEQMFDTDFAILYFIELVVWETFFFLLFTRTWHSILTYCNLIPQPGFYVR